MFLSPPSPTTMPLFFFLLLLLPLCAPAQHLALSCNQHPAYKPHWIPPLLRSFAELPRPAMFDRIVYIPRHTQHNYRPLADPTSTVYHNLDLFFSGGVRARHQLARLYFQRPATVYLFVGASATSAKRNHHSVLKLPGWNGHGWASLPGPSDVLQFGVRQKMGRISMQKYVYVFSKKSNPDNTLVVPSPAWVRNHLVAPFQTIANFQVRIAERNRRPSPFPGLFQGKVVYHNQKCPDELHDTWKVMANDPKDPDTKGRFFNSWHPAWDPCFWCAYDHEHGSSPYHLMGYRPRYNYAAWKNNRESESDPGFKGFVLQQGDYMFYFSLHAQASNLRRVNEQYHTIAVAITHARTKELMYEITHKADYGFLSARGKNVDFVPLSRYDEKMKEEQKAKWVRRRFRSINVIDKGNLDGRLLYRPEVIDGVYEEWLTLPICTWGPPFGAVIVDLKAPGTGIVSSAKRDQAVKLGRYSRNVGAARSIRMKDVQFGGMHCEFANKPNATVSGYFYTSPRGDELLDGPGKNTIRQYIKEGFNLKVSGTFEVAELGLGLHTNGALGFFTDHGYGLDPDKN